MSRPTCGVEIGFHPQNGPLFCGKPLPCPDHNPLECAMVDAIVERLGVIDLALCEAAQVVMRVGKLYRFYVGPDCEKCAELAAAYDDEDAWLASAGPRDTP